MFRLKYYKCFLDDTIVLFEIREDLQQFAEYMNKQHLNIIFSVEAEKNVKILKQIQKIVYLLKEKFLNFKFFKQDISG